MTRDEFEAIRKMATEFGVVSSQDVIPLLDALDAAWKELDRIPGSMA